MYNKKVLSTAKKELNKAKAPKKPKDIITDPMGQWKYPGLPTRIPGNDITMEGVGYPVLGVANNGQKQMMQPGEEYTFPGADYVDEYPQMRKGGTRKRRKTKSLSGTNKLMLPNPLLRNYKNRVYDPNVDYFQEGGVKGNWKVREELYDGEDEFFKGNPHVGGMAAEDDTVILNPYSKLSKAEKEAIIQNEKARLTMRNGYARPNFDLTEEQAKAFENYSPDIQDQRETVVGRIISGDPSQGNITEQQRQYAEELKRFMDMHKDTVLTNTSGPRNFQDGGMKTVKSKDGTITNVIQNPDGSKTVQVKTKNGKYYEKVVPMDYWGELDKAKEKYNEQHAYDKTVNTLGVVTYPASAASSVNDIMHGNYGDATLGFIPFVGPRAKFLGKLGNEMVDQLTNAGISYMKASKKAKNLKNVISGSTAAVQINDLIKQDGGYIEAELTEDEIEEYRKGGYIVEDISVPELTKAQEGVIQISDPKEFAYREKKYNDSLNAYNYGQKKLEKRNQLNKKYNIKENPANKWPASDKNTLVQKMVQKRTIYDVAPTDLLFTDGFHSYYGGVNGKKNKDPNLLISMTNEESGIPIHADSQDYKDLTFTVPFYKKPTQKPVLKSKKNEYPVGYQPYSLYGKVLDPERYGYGESNEGKPIQLGQQMEAFGKEVQMEKYKKANKYPWKKQEGGNSNYHKEGDSAYAWKVIPGKGAVTTHKHTDKNGNKTIKVIDSKGNHYIKTINKNGDVFNKTITKKELDEKAQKLSKNQMSMDDYMKNHGVGSAEWERKSSGAAQPVDWIWTLPMGGGRALAEEAGSLALQGTKGLFNLGKSAAKSNLVKLSKEGTKAFFNNTPKWITKVAPNLAPGINLNNLLTSYGIVEGANAYLDKDSDVRKANKKAYKNPNYNTITDALGENIINSLDFSGLAAGNKIGKLTNYITKETPLKNIPNLFKKDIKYVNLKDQIDDIVKNSSFKTEGEAFDYLIDHAKKNNKSVDDLLNIYSSRGFGFSHSNPIAAAEMIKNDLHPYVSPYLYHGTSDARLKSILESGLDNSKGKAVNTGGMMADVLGGGKTTAAGDMRYAKSFSEISANATEGKPVILRFKNKNKENLGFVGMHPSVKGKDIEYSFDGGKTWNKGVNNTNSKSGIKSQSLENEYWPKSLTEHPDMEYVLQKTPVKDFKVKPVIENLPTKKTHGYEVTKDEVYQLINQNLEYLTDPEYIKRRQLTTKESPEKIQKEINKYIENLKRSKIDFNTLGNFAGVYKPGKRKILNPFKKTTPHVGINPNEIKSRSHALHVLDHEIGHALSPISRGDFKGLPKYKNYPNLRIAKEHSEKGYLSSDYEQQVRLNRIKNYLYNKHGVSKNKPLSEEDFKLFTDDYNKWMSESHDGLGKGYIPIGMGDISDMLSGHIRTVGGGDKTRRNVRAAINKSWGLLPVGIGAGLLNNSQNQKLNQKKKGGIVAELTDDEIQDYIKQGYIVEDVD